MAKRSSKVKDIPLYLECTSECCLKEHATIILSCVALGNLKLFQHCKSICGNPFRIVDELGRNALHVAASKGHLHIVAWLLERQRVSIDLGDFESRWSALHRSIFYGNLGVALYLIKSGASLHMKDFDGCTPLALLSEDRKHFKSVPMVSEVNVYTWGNNSNLTLGHNHSGKHPQRLDLHGSHTISQVVLCKFHSVFLTEEGMVLTCGHGRGGRLGHGHEQSVVAPLLIQALGKFKCVAVAAARDHTVVLTESGTVYTCGLNDGHQLGLGTNTSKCLTPKPVKTLKSKHVTSVGVGRYHTAMCTSTEVYTVGKNLGQLGFDKHHESTLGTPRLVPGFSLEAGDSILHLSVSDAATSCITKRHRIFVCTAFTVKSIRCTFFEKCSCIQFTVCASLSDLDYLRKVETEPTKAIILDSGHQVWYWEPAKKGSVPNLMPELGHHKVTQLFLGKYLTIVTEDGEVYSSPAVSRMPPKFTRISAIQNAKSVFTDFKANNFAYLQNVYRAPMMPKVSPSTLSADLASLLDESCLPGSTTDLEIEVGDQLFCVHKFILATASPVFASIFHPESSNSLDMPKCVESYIDSRLVLMIDNLSAFSVFLHYMYGSHICIKHLPDNSKGTQPSESNPDPESTPDTSIASIDENDLTAVYDQYGADGFHSALTDDHGVYRDPVTLIHSTPKKPSIKRRSQGGAAALSDGEPQKEFISSNLRNDLKTLLQLASDFQISTLKQGLENAQSRRHALQKQLTVVCPKPSLKLQTQLSDLVLVSKEQEEISCHKCVLVARSDEVLCSCPMFCFGLWSSYTNYFRSMLLMGWRESSDSTKSLNLPISYRLLKAVVDYIYTDEAPDVHVASAEDRITSILVLADQLLLTRLKDMCEQALASQLNLRNVGDILEFAVAYSANQLKMSCLQFICMNSASLLEGRYLKSLDFTLLNELSVVYQGMNSVVTRRTIKFPDLDPSQLPESYFLDEDFAVDSIHSDSELPINNFSKDTREDTELWSSPASQEVVSPRSASSGSRKKRKRKISQSEYKGTLETLSPPPKSLESLTPKAENEQRLDAVNTPQNLATNQPQERGVPRTKLISRFNLPRNDRVLIVDADVGNSQQLPTATRVHHKEQEASPPPAPLPTKHAWSHSPSRFVPTTTLKEIMAMEEREKEKQENHKYDNKPQSPCHFPSAEKMTRRLSHPMSSPQAVPGHQQHISKQSLVSSPSSLPQSPPTNPWKVKETTEPVVSLRDLIAEAEAERKQSNQNESRPSGSSSNLLEECHQLRKKPPVIPHQIISFAAIVQDQQSKQIDHNKAFGKPFSSIQIEEQAIGELHNLYHTHNPDEYITVERANPRRASSTSSIAHSLAWCQDVVQ